MGLFLIGYGLFSRQERARSSTPTPKTTPPPTLVKNKLPEVNNKTSLPIAAASSADQKSVVAKTIATVGEVYKLALQKSGPIPEVAQPLRAAKKYWADSQWTEARTSAQIAWEALKEFQAKGESTNDTYEVVKGDTLWRIARDRSPVHQGPGWVTIWKANKNKIKDFNRIEVGLNLTIPEAPRTYIEPYWRPRQLAKRHPTAPVTTVWKGPPASDVVNLPEVLAWVHAKQSVPEPASLYAYLANREAAHSPFQQASFSVPAQPYLEPPQYH
jgi:LysM repeat protein